MIKHLQQFSVLLVMCVVLIFADTIIAQNDVIKVDTNLVSFEVTVKDANGNLVRNLEEADFKLFENNQNCEIGFFQKLTKSSFGRPLTVVFVIDISGSITNFEVEKLRTALNVFTSNLADYNSYFAVMSFGMDVKTLQNFTNNQKKLDKAFDKLLKDQDGLSTHAYDAVDDAIRLINRKSPRIIKEKFPKKAIILISDGFPVGDTVSPATVIERANESETSIYTIIIPSFSRLQGNKKPLPTPLEVSGLAEKTGGQSRYLNDKNFEPIFASLGNEITSSYIISYYPNGERGKQNSVRIETKTGLQVIQNRTTYVIK